ncbi:hypothetical protein E5676_scaffold16G004690 [Cucumis melo var. makuwa]|uniref:Uncharacterized protein n=1 Tax=Cucumis melo var. makuwa TaxID=1194695 RepID=A0A5D3CFP2_CUCMM|nr:hypothetical protein E5676_scaffold16G004690 [Cucumis melo var. makuwa]
MKKRCGFGRNGGNPEVRLMRINNTNVVDAAEGSEKESFMIRWMTPFILLSPFSHHLRLQDFDIALLSHFLTFSLTRQHKPKRGRGGTKEVSLNCSCGLVEAACNGLTKVGRIRKKVLNECSIVKLL